MATSYKKVLEGYFDVVLNSGASDLHLNAGQPPMVRVDSLLYPIKNEPKLTKETVASLVKELMEKDQLARFKKYREVDFSYDFKGKARFRVNVFMQLGKYAAALRLIPQHVMSLGELGLPADLTEFVEHNQGFLLVVGPTGHGKTTTVASLVDHINQTREDHIVTIEDPVEYVLPQGKGLIAQREVGYDTISFARALKSALRQDPNVVFIGEMRDLETISSALTVAETGHLVLSTLHTNDASQTVDRIIDVFPPHQQAQVRTQLASTLVGIVSQRLIPKIGGGRVPAIEVMMVNSAVKNLIREGKTHQLNNIIQTGANEGMIPLNRSLAHLVKEELITPEYAYFYSNDENDLKSLLRQYVTVFI